MYGKQLLVKDLQITVSINDDCNIVMKQVIPVFVACVMDGEKIVRVHADDGIEFSSESGFLSVQYKAGFGITHLCNKAALERQIQEEQEENDAMLVHTRGDL